MQPCGGLPEALRQFADIVPGVAVHIDVEVACRDLLRRRIKTADRLGYLVYDDERDNHGSNRHDDNGAEDHDDQHVGLCGQLRTGGGGDERHSVVEGTVNRAAAGVAHSCVDKFPRAAGHAVIQRRTGLGKGRIEIHRGAVHDIAVAVNDYRKVGFEPGAAVRQTLHHVKLDIHADDADINAVAEQRNDIGYHVYANIVIVIGRHPHRRAVVHRGVVPADMGNVRFVIHAEISRGDALEILLGAVSGHEQTGGRLGEIRIVSYVGADSAGSIGGRAVKRILELPCKLGDVFAAALELAEIVQRGHREVSHGFDGLLHAVQVGVDIRSGSVALLLHDAGDVVVHVHAGIYGGQRSHDRRGSKGAYHGGDAYFLCDLHN